MDLKIPKVSVVLPVYKDEKYVGEAIESILRQTFADFELIIVDDRSPDNTLAVIQAIQDPRIRLFVNEQNLGRAGSDNFALSQVRGQYVAKMDSDDLCHPQRLEKQVRFLDQHPEVNVVGSWMQNFGASQYLNQYPADAEEARCMTLFTLPVGNPSIMLRSDLFRQGGMHYTLAYRQTEDYDFFARYLQQLSVTTLPEALIQYRTYPDNFKTGILSNRHQTANRVRQALLEAWGIPASAQEYELHNRLAHLDQPLAPYTLEQARQWLARLYAYNQQKPWFQPHTLQHFLARKWFEVCYLQPQPRFQSLTSFYGGEMSKHYKIPFTSRVKFLLKGIRAYSSK